MTIFQMIPLMEMMTYFKLVYICAEFFLLFHIQICPIEKYLFSGNTWLKL